MNWYALHTKPRGETLAQRSLVREQIETFYPKLRRKKTIRRVRKWVTGPLFPCYIFARFDVSQSGRLVQYANGVIKIVGFGGKPAPVDAAIIDEIKIHCQPPTANCQLPTANSDTVTIAPPAFTPGELVEIQTGPFRGLQGIFEREMPDQDRVVILLETMARGARVQVSREELERI